MGKEDGREARKDASRARLIEAGFALLKSDGADALTMRGLAAAANLAPATAYNVFGSKHALFKAMFDQLNDQSPEESFDTLPGDALDRVLAITDQITRDWIDPKGAHRVLFEASQVTGSLASLLLPKVAPRVVALIDRLQGEGILTTAISANDLANRIAFAHAGLFEAWLDGQVTDTQLGREHRLNVLVALAAAASPKMSGRIAELLQGTLTGETRSLGPHRDANARQSRHGDAEI